MSSRVCFLFVLALVSMFALDSGEAETINVRLDGTGDTDNIESALSQSEDGDIIDVGPGSFEIQTYINREVTIRGSGVDSTSINCYADTSSYAFRITNNNVVLSDFTINDVTNCRSFSVQSGAQDVVIKNIKVHNVYSEAIYLESGTKTTLKNSVIGVQGASISSTGLYVYGNENIIDNNIFYGNSIYISGSNNQIKNNEISQTSDWSIRLYGNNNILSGNTVSASPENKDAEGGSRDTAFDYLVGTRTDSEIQFDWTEGNFFEGQEQNYFGVVWEASFYVGGGNSSEEGDYVQFEFYAEDGFRITIDGEVWRDYLDCYGGVSQYFNEWMENGAHTIEIEMVECTGSARAVMWWYSDENKPMAYQGKYFDHSRPADESAKDFKSIYVGSNENTVDETNYFESSKFILYYNQDGRTISGLNLGTKKVSNYDSKIEIRQSTNIVIEDLYFNYPSKIDIYSSSNVTVSNCDFINGHLTLSGNDNIVEMNTFTILLPEGHSNEEIYVNGNRNTIRQNSAYNGIDVYGDDNHIHNNSVDMGSGDGITIGGNSNIIAYNNVKNASSFGIYVGGSENLIDGNIVLNSSQEALYLTTISGTTVTERNVLKESCVVMYSDLNRTKETKKIIEDCNYSDLNGKIWNLDYYVYLDNSAWITIDSLNYQNIDKATAIYIENSNNISVNSFEVTSKEKGEKIGLQIVESEHISVSNSRFGELGTGIYSFSNEFLDFEDNVFANCNAGILDLASGDTTIEKNSFRNAAVGIGMTNSVFFTVENNVLRNDRVREMLGSGVGILISDAIHGSIINNEISGFDIAGIVYETVSYIKTENNEIYDNGVGIDLYDIDSRVYLKIHNNDIYDNQQYGIYSDSPVDARFNWWGDTSGPYQRCESQEGCEGNVNTEGKGNPVNSNVDASEQLYGSSQGFTIVNSIQSLAYEYKFPLLLILVVGIVGVIAWRRGWLEDWSDRAFAPSNTYPMASSVVEKPVITKKATPKKKQTKTVTIQCTNCSEKIKVEKKGKLQTITCASCGTSGEIDL